MKGRLWVVARSLPVHFAGGMERIAVDTCAGLAERGWAIDLATTRLARDPGLPPGVRVHALDAPPGVHSLRFRRALARWAEKREPPDALLSISFSAGPIVRARSEIPSICQMHGSAWREAATKLRRLDPRGLYRLWLHIDQEKRTLALYDRIVAVGPAVHAYLNAFPYGFLSRDKIVEIPNGIGEIPLDPPSAESRKAIREQLGLGSFDRLIVSAGRLIPQKGVFDLVRAYEKMPGCEKTALLIAGGGRDETRIRDYCRRHALAGVWLAGSLPREEVIEAMRVADLVVQIGTIPEAGIPLVVMESLAVGCPVVVSERLHFSHEDDIERAILRVDPTDRNAIARALERGVHLGGPFLEIARAARDRFSLDAMIERYDRLIEEVIGERRR
ncbi:MAG: glycosyltransferase family 4 protein [Candidatus Eisenbacteria bacterium]|nr:glycosyltransferase family 4 protein [Candidatus Eisenbacteria bacterium]